jgi:tetratricopeptide (TPR) repeat protein
VHELLRQYAQERLEKNPQASLSAQEAHAAYYTEFMQQRWGDLKGERQMLALAEVEADIENVRAAWRHYQDHRNAPQMWRFIKGIWYVYWIRWWNHAGMELFAEAANAFQGEQYDDEESTTVRALAMAFQGYFMAWLDLADHGYELAKDSVAILEQLDHPEALLFAYDSLLVNAYMVGRYTEEIEAGNKMLKIATGIDDKWLLAFTLFAVSMCVLVTEDYAEARQLAESNLKLSEEIGDVIGSTLPLIVLGHVALAEEAYESAREYYLRCLKISQQVGFHYAIQTASKYLGKVTLSMGAISEAEDYLLLCLRLTREAGFVRDIVNLFSEFARLRAAQGNFEGAVELLALVLQHPASHQTRMHEGRIRDSAKGLLAELEDELPPETYSAAMERGQKLELEAVIADLGAPK